MSNIHGLLGHSGPGRRVILEALISASALSTRHTCPPMPILTRRLREYLENPEAFSPSYRRYLKHALKRRIIKALEELSLIAEKDPELLKHAGCWKLVRNPPAGFSQASGAGGVGSSPTGPVKHMPD